MLSWTPPCTTAPAIIRRSRDHILLSLERVEHDSTSHRVRHGVADDAKVIFQRSFVTKSYGKRLIPTTHTPNETATPAP